MPVKPTCWEDDCVLFLDHGGMHVTADRELFWGANKQCDHCGAYACACEPPGLPPYKVGSYASKKGNRGDT